MVTAELAMGIPALVFLLLFGVSVLSAVAAQARCADAARIGARAAARGEPDDVVRRWAQRAAPPGAVIAVHRSDGAVEVRVRVESVVGERLPLPAVDVEASAVTPTEDVDPPTAVPAGEEEDGNGP